MKTPFKDIQDRIDYTRAHLEAMYDQFSVFSAPGYDPINIPDGEDFPRGSATVGDLTDRLQEKAPTAEVEYQLAMVVFCLRQMEITTRIIELQNSYKKNVPEQGVEIDATINDDVKRFHELIGNAGELREKRALFPYHPLDEESYRENLHELMDANAKADAGKIRWEFEFASKNDELLDYLFEDRLIAMDMSLTGVELVTKKIQRHIEDYMAIHIALDENIVQPSLFLKEQEKEKKAYAVRMLPRAQAHLNTIEHFMDQLRNMGSHDQKYENFTVGAYVPLSVKALPKFTP